MHRKEVANLCADARDLTDGAFDPWSVPGSFDPSGYVKGWAASRPEDAKATIARITKVDPTNPELALPSSSVSAVK